MLQAAGPHLTHIGSCHTTTISMQCSHWHPDFQIREQSTEKINNLYILLVSGRASLRTPAWLGSQLRKPWLHPSIPTRPQRVSCGPPHPARASDVYISALRGFETPPTRRPALPGSSLPSLALQWLLLIFWPGACQTLFLMEH